MPRYIRDRTALWYRLERIGELPEEEKPVPQVVEHIHRHSEMGQKEFILLQQTAAKVEYLLGKVNERDTKKKYITY